MTMTYEGLPRHLEEGHHVVVQQSTHRMLSRQGCEAGVKRLVAKSAKIADLPNGTLTCVKVIGLKKPP